MGRAPCCDKNGLKKGPWTPEEDEKLIRYIQLHGPGNWRILPKNAGLQRCGKSCRLRWTNYLRPDIKRGRFSFEEEETIIQLHSVLGNKWSAIAARLPGRTDNEIKNYWNTHIRKRLLRMGIDPVTHSPRLDLSNYLSSAMSTSTAQLSNLSNFLGIQAMLNPEILSLLGNLINTPQNQINPETQLPTLVDPNQFQLPTSTVDQFNSASSIPNQFELNPNQYFSSQTDCGANFMGQVGVENWLLNNNQSFGFDSFGSTQMNSSCNNSSFVNGSSSSEDDGSSLKFEIPAGCVDINDFL